MTTISIDEIKNDVGRFFDRIQGGEAMLVMKAGQPVAEVIPPTHSPEDLDMTPRPYALARGEFVVPKDFNDPLPEDILRDFEGR